MPIPAKRFQLLDSETDVPYLNSFSAAGSDVYNTTTNAPPASPQTVQGIIDSAIQGINNTPASASTSTTDVNGNKLGDAVNSATRSVKGIFGTNIDLKKFSSTNQITNYLTELVPGAQNKEISSLTKMAQSCSTGLGHGIPGRPYDASAGCSNGKASTSISSGYGGMSSNCNASSFSNLLNALTNNQYGGTFGDIMRALGAIMALSGYGYGLGMCGVFGTLAKQYGNDNLAMLGRASGSLLGTLSSSGNSSGAMDVMKDSVGLPSILENPSGIKDFFKGFKIPGGIGERNYSTLTESALGSPTFIDDGYTCSEIDGGLSAADMEDCSSDFYTTGQASRYDKVYDASNLGHIPADDSSFMTAALFA